MTIFCQNCNHENTQIRHFWSQIGTLFFLNEYLHFDKLEGVNFKYDNSFLNCSLNIPIKAFLVSSLSIFIFCTKLYTRKLRQYQFQMWQELYTHKNTQKRHFWSQSWFFLFCTNICILANLSALISNIKIVFW